MEVLQLSKTDIEIAALRAAEVLRAGEVVLYPTDTLYGLAADAFSDAAVAKLYAIKGRDERKPIHAIVADLAMANEYGEVDARVTKLVENLPAGKITYVVKKKRGLTGGIASTIDTFGFRIPDNAFCLALARAYGRPYTATSANRAGEKPQRSISGILAQLGNEHAVALAIDAGELPERGPSSVVDCSGQEILVLREGAVSSLDIHKATGI